MKWLRDRPALALFIIAPLFGELFSGSTPLDEYMDPLVFVILGMLYGCGAILARELTVRWNRGWLGLLLLGFAYGIYEEGLVVRSFFDPNWMDLGVLGIYGRVLGVNWVWALHLTLFHGVVSILASVAFVELLYPARRGEPWVTSRRWWWANWIALLAVWPIGMLLNPYAAPIIWIGLSWLAIFLLIGLARIAPRIDRASRRKAPPRPIWFFLLALGGAFLHFVLVYIGAEEGIYPFPVAMWLVALADLLFLWVILGWRGSRIPWDERHRMALIVGVLGFFLLFPLLLGPESPVMYVSNPLFFLALGWSYRRIQRRVATDAAPSTQAVSHV